MGLFPRTNSDRVKRRGNGGRWLEEKKRALLLTVLILVDFDLPFCSVSLAVPPQNWRGWN
jgi:hypothetical protein